MQIIINHSSMIPIYEQIIEQVKALILKGELKENDALPSVRALSKELKISALTVKKADDNLEQEGFTTSQVGIGTFVSTGNVELLRDSKRHMVEKQMQELIDTAKSLDITKDELNAMMDILYEEE